MLGPLDVLKLPHGGAVKMWREHFAPHCHSEPSHQRQQKPPLQVKGLEFPCLQHMNLCASLLACACSPGPWNATHTKLTEQKHPMHENMM